jgi:signal transduction histidine kinase
LGLRGLEDSEALIGEDRYLLPSVLEEVRFLKFFVGDLLDATRFQDTSPRLTEVFPLFNAVRDSQKRVAQRAKIEILIEPGDRETVACIDKNAMIRAIGNLVKNAIEACEPGGKVVLGWRDVPREDISRRLPGFKGDVLCLFVEDNGTGMPNEVMQNLFTPFTTTKLRGNGLGLSLVRETVAGHGGIIEVITPVNALGGGTRFEILLAKGDRPSCLDYHGNCTDGCLTCPIPEGCPVREIESYNTCWVIKGRASLKETGRWNEECVSCPVFLQGNLEHFYFGPSYRNEGM